MEQILKKLTLTMIFAMLVITTTFAQITTSAVKGTVLDENGQNLPGATVVAIHQPSGTQYAAISGNDGRFVMNNMRVGGPYEITISFVGYASQKYQDVTLSLGNVSDLQVKLAPSVTELNEIVVSVGRNSVINSERTGAAINVNNEMAGSVPTISRGLKDFTKISPLANNSGSGTSFAGSNNRYNQFSIDGLVNNDVFGLTSSGTNGGQTGIEPISLDAIEEFQINIAPYDVRQGGFTGGGINAVTKSGTNKVQGSIYFYGNNQKLVGKHNAESDATLKVNDYKDYQAGFTLGGPIIKNKLFFFINAEMTKSITPLSNVPGTASSNISTAEVDSVLTALKRVSDYDPGSYLAMNDETNSQKFLAKINWNISNKHKLILRHSYTYGENIDNSRSKNALRFYNNGQYFPSTTNSTGLELNSVFSANTSNKLSLGYTRVRDDRDPLGDPFPTVLINLRNSRTITLGSEYSSVANQLDQDIISITDDFSWFLGKHTITFGTHNELYSFYNLFVQNIFGSYAYRSLKDFYTVGTATEVAPTYYAIGYSLDPNDGMYQSKGAADFKAMQLGLYGQDEFQVAKNFLVTAGLRIDVPMFPDSPKANAGFNTAYVTEGVATGTVPETKIMWSPRFGFNWDVLGNKSLQVRGGTGLFTGRVPFVWISNQFTNNGMVNGSYSKGNSSSSGTPMTSPAGMNFIANPANQRDAVAMGGTAGSGAINVVDKDFKFPQVFRTNLAVDFKLPWDIFATIEGVFSKTYNNVNFVNLNRDVDDAFTFTGKDTRPRYRTGRVNTAWDEIVKCENTNKGYSYNVVFMLQKQFENGLNAQASYTYGKSMDLNSGTSSVAYSNWRYVNNVYGLNDLKLTRSNYDLGSRVTGLISYKFEYLDKKLSTQISLFYNGQSGQPKSYIYNGDMNNDGTSNDLIYIPKTKTDINLVDIPATTGPNPTPLITAAEQWAALETFIMSDSYLSENRGKYAERNAARLPFSHQFDVRILQDLKVNIAGTSNKLQLSVDIINIGNMFNKDWGHSIYASNQQWSLINYKGVTGSTPSFTYTGAGMTKSGDAYQYSDFLSRWRMQIGIRYIFN